MKVNKSSTMSASPKGYMNGRPKLFKKDTFRGSFIKGIKSNQIIPLLFIVKIGGFTVNKMPSITVSPFIRRFSSHKLEDLAQNSANSNIKLNPWWVIGFVDGEGCFTISILKDKNRKTGWDVKPSFSLSLHIKDLYLLEKIKNHLGVGKIYKRGQQSAQLQVSSVKEIAKLMEYFSNYPLITKKWADCELLKRIINLMLNKQHLTEDGLHKIVALKASMNNGLSAELYAAFPNLKPVPRPSVENKKVPHEQWIAGFTSGEGCFMVRIFKTAETRLGFAVKLEFIVTQHSREEQLMTSLMNYFNCGHVYKNKSGTIDFKVTKFADLENIIIPFLKKNNILGVKSKDFEDWSLVAEMMKNAKHLTKEGLEQIKLIKAGMNRGRKLD
jgi:hypothetical protein